MTQKDGATGGRERRSSARIPIEMWVQEITDEGEVHRRAGNLSAGGLYLDKTIPIPVGTTVQLRFRLPGEDDVVEAMTVTGVVVSIDPTKELGMGVKFVQVPAAAQARLDGYLKRALTPIEIVTAR
jgi:type IV pilus assembly protein PilZ